MTDRPPRRAGFALIVTLIALTLALAMMLAAIYRTSTDARVARLATLRARSLTAAESALWTNAAAASARSIRAMPIGASTRITADSGEISTFVTLVRVDTSFAWLVSESTIRRGNDVAYHRVGMSLRLSRDSTDLAVHEIPDRGWAELF